MATTYTFSFPGSCAGLDVQVFDADGEPVGDPATVGESADNLWGPAIHSASLTYAAAGYTAKVTDEHGVVIANSPGEIDVAAEVAGVEVVRKRLGPFRVTHQTAGIAAAQGAALSTALPPGTVIELAWLEAIETWETDAALGDAFLMINVTSTANPTTQYDGIVYYELGMGASQNGGTFNVAGKEVMKDNDAGVPSRLKQEATVNILASTATTWTSGTSDLYVLISEPA